MEQKVIAESSDCIYHSPLVGRGKRKSVRNHKYNTKERKKPEAATQLALATKFKNPCDAYHLWKAMEEEWPDRLAVDTASRTESVGCFAFNRTKKAKGAHNNFIVDVNSWKQNTTLPEVKCTEKLKQRVRKKEYYKQKEKFWDDILGTDKLNICHLVILAGIGYNLMQVGNDPEKLPELWKIQYQRAYMTQMYTFLPSMNVAIGVEMDHGVCT
jgi:hypothetical protein